MSGSIGPLLGISTDYRLAGSRFVKMAVASCGLRGSEAIRQWVQLNKPRASIYILLWILPPANLPTLHHMYRRTLLL